uniref:Uncharacterized protein MANES_15G141500 n=1 Tax=Rhizophora mucronata TaxID=61149 RepID=A0A2P2KRE8_RHIMU
MKRDFDEISDEEWAEHDFKPSRVLGVTQHNRKQPKSYPPPPPPHIESFAFRKSSESYDPEDAAAVVPLISDDDDDCIDITEPVKALEDVDNLDDDDDDDDDVVEEVRPAANRSRRFVIDDDEQEDEEKVEEEEKEKELTEVYDIDSSDGELGLEMGEDVEEDDVVGVALQKCSKISAELKRELYGSATTSCQRYAEVFASSVRIVTQNDINKACAVEDSNFQPILKPYQLVGVNFLLLLYHKGIGGAILADEMGLGKTIQVPFTSWTKSI